MAADESREVFIPTNFKFVVAGREVCSFIFRTDTCWIGASDDLKDFYICSTGRVDIYRRYIITTASELKLIPRDSQAHRDCRRILCIHCQFPTWHGDVFYGSQSDHVFIHSFAGMSVYTFLQERLWFSQLIHPPETERRGRG